MIQNYFQNVKRFSGSSFVSPAYGWSGTRATINYNSPAAEKNSGEARKQAGKKEGGLGEGIFARLLSAEGGMGWESVSAIPASAGRQNRNIFVSLIEKNFGGARIKKCKENFSVLLAEAKRRRAETLGGIQSAKSSGFCSKKVRISSNKHHHIELVASLGASPLVSLGVFLPPLFLPTPLQAVAKTRRAKRGGTLKQTQKLLWEIRAIFATIKAS